MFQLHFIILNYTVGIIQLCNKLTNRIYTWVCLILSNFRCEHEGELDSSCPLEPWCYAHKLSLVWIVLPFYFFGAKHTSDVLWLLCTWAKNPDRCPTKNGATSGNQQQLTWNWRHDQHLNHGWTDPLCCIMYTLHVYTDLHGVVYSAWGLPCSQS